MIPCKEIGIFVFTLFLIVITSSIVLGYSCLVDGYVFSIGTTPVSAGTPVTVEVLKPLGDKTTVNTGDGYPPIPIFFNQYKAVVDCNPGDIGGDLIHVYTQNATHKGENQGTMPTAGQIFLNITRDQIRQPMTFNIEPAVVRATGGEYVTVNITLTNNQFISDTFTFTLQNNTDFAEFNQTSLTLAPGEGQNITLTLMEGSGGSYSINVTVTSNSDGTITETKELLVVVNHVPELTKLEFIEWNTTDPSLPPYDKYVNFSARAIDLDGTTDTSQLIVCANETRPVDGKCINNNISMCKVLNAPVTASEFGVDLECVHPTNDSIFVYYGYVCDSLHECSDVFSGVWCEGECNVTVNLNMTNKTFDNSPTFEVGVKVNNQIPVAATCYYKTDYDPTSFFQINPSPAKTMNYSMAEQNWSYIPTNLGRYEAIQHYDYYSGTHNLTVMCDLAGSQGENSTLFNITYTQRDKVYYQDGDEINLYLRLEESGLNLKVNFSQLDSGFTGTNYEVNNTGLDYNITYNISETNTREDGQYNVTIEAIKPGGNETMNGSIFVHLHNNWTRTDIDNAFDCWSFKQGYYFDEVACDWESDLNHVADLVDVFTVETSCFDTIDNDLDGKVDADDTDCAGQYYSIRRDEGIDSAFLGDPCFNNVCRVCVGGTDNDNDGICDTGDADGINVRYLNKVRPGKWFRAKFLKPTGVNGLPIRISVNYLPTSFAVTESQSSIQQLPVMELGGCSGGTDCKSVTGTTYNPPNPDKFTGTSLTEKVEFNISASSDTGNHPEIAAGKSIDGLSAFQNLVFFEVNDTAIVYEGDNSSYCFDEEDNDLDDHYDCQDLSCDLVVNASTGARCEYATELTCDDGFDNDGDGYTDCQDNNCFQKNGTAGPCYAVEDYSTSSCANNINDDHDWGVFGNQSVSRSYEDQQSGDIQLTDCLDIDCDNDLGNTTLNARCEYALEDTCGDGFDNDADGRYDCTGNAYQSTYERDCDRWNNILGGGPLYVCPRTETICNDELDNDLDSDYPDGITDPYLGIDIIGGGWDCQDYDCNGQIGEPLGDALCQFRNETTCDDNFDNDGDGLTDCYDPTYCTNKSGYTLNLTGLCRPCSKQENISIDSCRDGFDNDYDGLKDCNDPDCYGLAGPGRTWCGVNESSQCADGIDNDYDMLIDDDDPDCKKEITYTDETGPGMCYDSIDNDNDGNTDCSDPDCATSMICLLGSFNNPCATIGTVGAIDVCRNRFVTRGNNLTFRYTRSTLVTDSIVLKAGNVQYSLRDVAPILNGSTNFMTGSTGGFVKLNDTYGLKAQNDPGFSGTLNLWLTATTGVTVTPGWYTIFVSTSIPGVYGTKNAAVYIGENEEPTVENVIVDIGDKIITGTSVNVTIEANATDSGTYNSGIALCEYNLTGGVFVNESNCRTSLTLGPGSYRYSVRAYDGALNPSDWVNVDITVPNRPLQEGDFYDPYSGPGHAANHPERVYFYPPNVSDLVNIGVNFAGGTGYTSSSTGCVVTIYNQTEAVSTQYVDLDATSQPGKAICNGQINLTKIDATGNASAVLLGVYHFTVNVTDNSATKAQSEIEGINVCKYKNDTKTGELVCYDACDKRGVTNQAPVLILNISNQTWPQNTRLSTIDLDDHFYDPDHDPLTFNWTIDTSRIEVEIDNETHFVTFKPDQTFVGFAYVTFYASDPWNTTASNLVELEVTKQELPIPPTVSSGGGGGGGGGGRQNLSEPCEENWICSDWSICFPNSLQSRTCKDLNECRTQLEKPDTQQSCIYVPTCRDRIKNQNEEGVDCGGPCPACPSCEDGIQNRDESGIDCGGIFCAACATCNDNIQNQNEEGVDCGGPCPACQSCSDGIKNQGELNIDCGGPCIPCSVKVVATVINWNAMLLIASLLVLALLIIVVITARLLRKKYLRLKAKTLNYYMRAKRMFEKKKPTEKEMPILNWLDAHLDTVLSGQKDISKAVTEVDKLIRIFFKRVFFIRYAFTDEELVKEIQKHKIGSTVQKATEILFEELAQIKYGGEDIDEQDLHTLVDQVKVITERVISEIESKKKLKIGISEKDLRHIDKTLKGAKSMSIKKVLK